MSPTTPTAVFLDFDGVVCDTERAAVGAWHDLYDRLGLSFPDRLLPLIVGNSAGARVALADLAERLGREVTADEWAWQRGRKADRAAGEAVLPGVERLIDLAALRGVPVAVVSSGAAAWVGGHLRRLGLRDRLAVVVTGEDADRHKPAPDLYLAALRIVGTAAGDAVAVEDSPIGVQAAKAAGLRCVAVPNAHGRPEDLAAADLVLPSLDCFDPHHHFRPAADRSLS